MSMTKDAGEHVFECNRCHETLETGERDFDRARAVFADAGDWSTRKVDGEWFHFCSEECKEAFYKARRDETRH